MKNSQPDKYRPHYMCPPSKKKKICEKCESEFHSMSWAVRNCPRCRKKK